MEALREGLNMGKQGIIRIFVASSVFPKLLFLNSFEKALKQIIH